MLASLLSLQKRILGLVILFLLIGQMMLFSATGIMGLQQHGSEFYFVARQAMGAALGLGLMFALSHVRYQVWERLAHPIIIVQILLLMATTLSSFGHNAQGASRWLRLGPLQFQPSELAKVSITFFAARFLASGRNGRRPWESWVYHSVMFIVLLFLVFRQPDLGSTLLLACIVMGLFFISGARVGYVLGAIGAATAFAVYFMLHSEYRRRRVIAFLNPWADPHGSGFQTIQSFLSFHSGKLFGTGIGNGNSKLFYLPEVHTDFIFSLIGEELGFFGAILVLLLFIYFGYLLFKAALNAPDAFGCYLGCGLTLSLLLQIAVNLGGVTGILPVKGLPLPFISWGRSALIVNLAMVGILLNIVRQSGILPKPNPPTRLG